ncbi:response regulator transcription factor [Stenotrophomonas sp. NPDC087984]
MGLHDPSHSKGVPEQAAQNPTNEPVTPARNARQVPTSDIIVVLYGGDPLARAGAADHIGRQPDMSVVQAASRSADEAIGYVAVSLSERVEASHAAQLRKLATHYKRRVVLVCDELDEHQLSLVAETGIASIVWRHQATAQRLVKAIQAAARDEGDLPGNLLRRILAKLGRQTHGTVVNTVAPGRPTPRELSVLELVAQGLSTKEIAEKLDYSERTIKGLLHDVMMRLHLRNRTHGGLCHQRGAPVGPRPHRFPGTNQTRGRGPVPTEWPCAEPARSSTGPPSARGRADTTPGWQPLRTLLWGSRG